MSDHVTPEDACCSHCEQPCAGTHTGHCALCEHATTLAPSETLAATRPADAPVADLETLLAEVVAAHVYEMEFLGSLGEVWTKCTCGERIDATPTEGRSAAEVFKGNYSAHVASVQVGAYIGAAGGGRG